MAKGKRSARTPQAQHARKSAPSRHDKRERLNKRNPDRKATTAAKFPLVGALAGFAESMGQLLDSRIAFRFPILLAGVLRAKGRRTASKWLEGSGATDDWDRFYDLLPTVGKRTRSLVTTLLAHILRLADPGPDGRWKLAVDDSPTPRYGRRVEGANVHHNPTPGPAKQNWLFGHNWVTIAFLVKRPLWGVVALPILSKLYVRKQDVEKLKTRDKDWKFQTKLELALTLAREVMEKMRALGSKAGWLLMMDGAYAAGALLRQLLADGVHVISRLRRDAELYDVPVRRPGERGRPRIYGKNRISLAKRAKHAKGWETIAFLCRGAQITRRYKTFLATTRLTHGIVRVVILEHDRSNWAAYFRTDSTMDAKSILENGAERWAIEETFHDVKEIRGAGQQ